MPGGVDTPLSAAAREEILAAIPEALAATTRALDWYTGSVGRWADEAARFGAFPSAFLALVGTGRDGTGGLAWLGSSSG